MAILDLLLVAAWLGLVVAVPSALHYRRTGQPPIRRPVRPGGPPRWVGVCTAVGIALAVAAPVAELAGLPPFTPLDNSPTRWIGVALVVGGVIATLAAQAAMGSSWRGDVDPDDRTALITSGPFRLVRNPILASGTVVQVGLALVVPNVVSVAMLISFFAAIEIQVRLVEEPYLLRVHGDAYRAYAARTGRFLPGVGKLRSQ
jgi:protein-S-isoprenylcysteine O-methyltransferase Ste14